MTTTATNSFNSAIPATLALAPNVVLDAERGVRNQAGSRTVVSPEASAYGSEIRIGVSPEASAYGSGVRASLLSGAVTRHIRNGIKEVGESGSLQLDKLNQTVVEIAPDDRALGSKSIQSGNTLSTYNFSRHLLDLSKHIDRVHQANHSVDNNYTRQLLLSSILPLYLRSSSQPLSKSLSSAIQLVWEHRIMLTLDHLLEGDLISVIHEEDLGHLSPIDAARQVLNMDLCDVVKKSHLELQKEPSGNSSTHPHFLLNSNERDGYWAIASQWIQQREAISLPANLAVGAVSWQRLRGHWQKVSACLSNTFSHDSAVTSKNIEIRNHSETRNAATRERSVDRSKIVSSQDSSTSGSIANKNSEATEQLLASAQESIGHLLPDVIEIRSSNDPELAKNLEVHLQRCRDRSGSLALVVIRCKSKLVDGLRPSKDLAKGSLCKWQLDLINTLQTSLEHRKMYGFYTTDGDLALIMEDVDRSEVTSLVRTVIEQESQVEEHETRLLDEAGLPLFSGIACVQSPTKSFRLSQLIESAWRCLEATLRQPPGSVKSIEVY